MINLIAYKTHNSVDELKATEKAQIRKHYLNGNVQKVFTYLVKSSFGNLGACKVKAETIANKLGISRSTVTRCLKKLRDLKLIESHTTKKQNGEKGANIYSILFLHQGEPNLEPNLLSLSNTRKAVHENTVIPTVTHEFSHTQNEVESFNSFNLSFNPFVNKNVFTYNARSQQTDVKEELRTIYNPQTEQAVRDFEELCKIAFGRLKQFMKTHNMPYLQMVDIITNCMKSLVNKTGVKNQFALYSSMIKRQVEQLFEQYVQPTKQAVQTFNGRNKELVPEWFETRHETVTSVKNDAIDFEAERAKILAKLG